LIHVVIDLRFRDTSEVVSRRRPSKMRATTSITTRPPAVAGLFYDRDADRLRKQVTDLLAGPTAPGDRPKALIAPHAGYVYSGAVAGAAFSILRGHAQSIRRVVLIGPAHYVAVRGVAIPMAGVFETPLGHVPLDSAALDSIGDLASVVTDDEPHAPEHALEVELPFLQTVLPLFRLVPLVVGDATPQEVAQVLARLWGGPETLIVVSSDLSHYHSYETARRLDAATAVAIEDGDWARLGPGQACGCLAVAGLLIESGRRGLKAQRLALCNSGDTAGSRDRVVGYGSWMFA
jgi:MEMO1 family protein